MVVLEIIILLETDPIYQGDAAPHKEIIGASLRGYDDVRSCHPAPAASQRSSLSPPALPPHWSHFPLLRHSRPITARPAHYWTGPAHTGQIFRWLSEHSISWPILGHFQENYLWRMENYSLNKSLKRPEYLALQSMHDASMASTF